ncbi:MAG: malate synthase G [Sphingomicrobium sp.]
MTHMTQRGGLEIADELVNFIEESVLPGTGVNNSTFWRGVANIFATFTPENTALLAERDRLQAEIDHWHDQRAGEPHDGEAYIEFLRDIGYLVDEPEPFRINTKNLDSEISAIAGPQLVVPVLNARFLLNAANARWGSLYDALYGTDALGTLPAAGAMYDSIRGAEVIAWSKSFLDRTVPLRSGCWADLQGPEPALADPTQLVGRRGGSLLFRHNGLHLEVVIDRSHPVGREDPAGIADVVLESALTTIVDLEDSVAVVDEQDKVAAYRHWLGLLRGDLEATFEKGGQKLTRALAEDRTYLGLNGEPILLKGRSLLLVRNVGHSMTTPAVLLPDESEAPEGILDAIVTTLIALHDLRGLGRHVNSARGSVYIVKPKMHGPREVDFTNRLFNAVEDLLGLDRHTIKVGLMDEERRTSTNLPACIAAVKDRIFFINTGFLDRTGDEIHTSMRAGPMIRKGDMKFSDWIAAYENRNVQIGLASGFSGRAQIGKGMWAAPDRMSDMLEQKKLHPAQGANTAWVPSPTAATLHATHYHAIDVFARQQERATEPITSIDALLRIPLADGCSWSSQQIRDELDNNAQGILGYVVRWVEQGVGCSKVPDIHDVGLMEDRATLRISSQALANWLWHGVCTQEEIEAALRRMAARVDTQNSDDPHYRPMRDGHASAAYQAARALIFEGVEQPGGYTEPTLHRFRRLVKQQKIGHCQRALSE